MILNICDNGDVLSALRVVRISIMIIRIAVPLILIISLMLNYFNAMTKGDDDALSNAHKSAIIKVVAAILVFLIPTFVNFIVRVVDPNSDSYISCIGKATPENISTSYSDSASKYVDKAYKTLERTDYNKAVSAVKKVKNTNERTKLNKRLKEISKYVNINDRIKALSVEYSKDEVNKIQKEINKITDSTVKTKLQKKLDAVKEPGGTTSLDVKPGVHEKSDYDKEMRYIEVIPEGATTNMPMIIYFAGIWSYSSFSQSAPNYYITKYVKSGKAYKGGKFILIIPRVVLSQGDERGLVKWQTEQGKAQTKKVKGLIDFLVKKYKINPKKISVTGVSLGGDGAWNMVETYPTTFASAVPISGCASRSPIVKNYTSTPIICYHGTGNKEDDYKQCVPNIYNKIKSAGGKIELRVKSGYSHGDMQKVYSDDNGAIFEWMLKQER